jgi:hypothetical protein
MCIMEVPARALTVCDTFLSCCLKVMPVTQQRCLLHVLEAELASL